MSSFKTNLLVLVKGMLPKGHFSRSVAVLAGGTTLSQALVVLAFPLLTRLYTPEDLGVLAVYTSILSILVVIASLRYELAIPLAENDEAAANLLGLSLFIVLWFNLLTALGVWLLGDQIAHWVNTPVLKLYLWLLPLSLFGSGTYEAFSYWAIRKKAFPPIAQTRVSQSLGQVLTQLILGLLKLRPGGLLVGDVVGRLSGSGILAVLLWRKDGRTIKGISIPEIRSVACRYRRFPLLSSGSALLNSAGLQLPALLLAAFFGPHVAGWFALGQRVVGVPMALLGRAVAQVYFGEASWLAREEPGALRRLFLMTARRLLLVGGIPIGLLSLSSPWLFAFVFGDAWFEAGRYVQLLAFMFLVQFVVVPLSQTLNILERQDLQLVWDAGRLILVVGGLVIAGILGCSAWTAILVYSIAMLVSYGVLFILCTTAINGLRSSR